MNWQNGIAKNITGGNGPSEYQIDSPPPGKLLWDALRALPQAMEPRGKPFFVENEQFVSLYNEDGTLCWVFSNHDEKTYHPPFETGAAIRLLPKVERIKQRAEAKPASRTSVVYFIGDPAVAIKIGFSVDFPSRLRNIQSCSPIPLQTLATVHGGERVEAIYHAKFAAHRLHGEWFTPAPDILAEIERLNTGANQ